MLFIIGNSLIVISKVLLVTLTLTLEKKPVIYRFLLNHLKFHSLTKILSFKSGTNFLIKDSDNLCSPVTFIFLTI